MKVNNDANWIVKIPDQSDIYANDATDYQYTNDMRRQQFDTSLTSINDSLPVIIKHEDVDDVARPSDQPPREHDSKEWMPFIMSHVYQ